MGICNNEECGKDYVREPCLIGYVWEDRLDLGRNKMSYSHKMKRMQWHVWILWSDLFHKVGIKLTRKYVNSWQNKLDK